MTEWGDQLRELARREGSLVADSVRRGLAKRSGLSVRDDALVLSREDMIREYGTPDQAPDPFIYQLLEGVGDER